MTVANDDPLRRVVSENKKFQKVRKKRLDEKEEWYIIDYIIKRKRRNKEKILQKPLDERKNRRYTKGIKRTKTHGENQNG